MKPHLRFSKGRWKVYRHRSVCSRQLPTVMRKDFREALQAHFEYVNVIWPLGDE